MSGPGLEPACLGVDYSGKFFKPDSTAGNFNVTYRPGEDAQISWFGGRYRNYTVQQVSLHLTRFDEPQAEFMNILGKLSHHKFEHQLQEILVWTQC